VGHFGLKQVGNLQLKYPGNFGPKRVGHFGVKYPSKIISDEIFELLEGIDLGTDKIRRDLAIERAKRNYNLFDHSNYANEESSTTVFKLVEELIKYI
jgi:hypothetical protein